MAPSRRSARPGPLHPARLRFSPPRTATPVRTKAWVLLVRRQSVVAEKDLREASLRRARRCSFTASSVRTGAWVQLARRKSSVCEEGRGLLKTIQSCIASRNSLLVGTRRGHGRDKAHPSLCRKLRPSGDWPAKQATLQPSRTHTSVRTGVAVRGGLKRSRAGWRGPGRAERRLGATTSTHVVQFAVSTSGEGSSR